MPLYLSSLKTPPRLHHSVVTPAIDESALVDALINPD
jgi:hypothetical protein